MSAYGPTGPNESNQERLVSEALVESQEPEDLVRMIQPPLPQIVAFPPRFGWPSYSERQPGIEGVFDLDRLYADHRNERSGGYTGSSRNVSSDGGW
jgi:hypothetical protein